MSQILPADGKLAFSVFTSLNAKDIHRRRATWSELCDVLCAPPEFTGKAACPLIKLARFGDTRTTAGSLRSNGNMLEVTGIEADYDAGQVPIQQAADMLQAAGIECCLYSSPSSTLTAPRWRVLAPLSRPYPPSERRRFVRYLNDALGGIFAPESFTPSQAYYFGRVSGAQYEFVPVHGQQIDLLAPASTATMGAANTPDMLGCAPVPEHLRGRLLDASTRSLLEGMPKSFALILEKSLAGTGCGQVRNAYLHQNEIPEPLWRACISVAWACSDGHQAIHKMSQQHDKYNPAETDLKAAGCGGPYRCETFKQNWPEHCEGCAQKLTSPVQLGAEDKPMLATPSDWPEPMPLPAVLPPVKPFNSDLLPTALRDWVMDIAHRMQCPADFPAVGAVVALSSLIGARAVVQPKARDDWQVVPNLWGLVIGRPGVMKSPALSEALKPLHRLQTNEQEVWQAQHDVWAVEAKIAELQSVENEKKARGLVGKDIAGARALLQQVSAQVEPVARRFIVNDATVEKLGELLQLNPWGTLSYRDEIYGLLTGMEKQGQEGARAFYLQAYDGNQGYTFDRIGRGTLHIPRTCLAMLGGIQPSRVQEYVRGAVSGGSADDGLLQRFGLTVWPDVTAEFHHVDQRPNTQAKQHAWDVFERLAALQPASDTEPQVWRFDPAAQALFVEWLVPFETEIRGNELHPAMVSHLAKYRKLIPALALVFSLIDTPDGDRVIRVPELARALAWGDYLRSHAERLYSAAGMPEISGAAALLRAIQTGKLGVEFTPRLAAKKGWAGLATPDAVRAAAAVLVDYGWLRCAVLNTGGRPSEIYTVHTAALAG